MKPRTCPLCNHTTTQRWCCGLDLTARRAPWSMTKERIRQVRAFAHGTKGLDAETFRLYLSRVGATSTTTLTQDQHRDLMAALGRLPNAVKARGGKAA